MGVTRSDRYRPVAGVIRRTGHLVATGLLVLCQPLATAVIVVEGDCTLVNAITAANTDSPVGACPAGDPGEDVVELTEDVILTEVDNDTDGLNGLPSVTSQITIEGHSFSVGRQDGFGGIRIFHVGSGGALTLNDTMVVDGNTLRNGGGIFNGDTLTLVNSTVSDNRAAEGGGIYQPDSGSTMTLRNSEVSGNYAQRWGGGIYLRGDATLTNSSVSNNRADYGGGIGVLEGSLTIDKSTLSGNTSSWSGGAISAVIRSTVFVTNSTLSGNSSFVFGGGVYSGSSGTATLTNSTLGNNTAVRGDNVYAYYGSIRLRGSIVFLGDCGSVWGDEIVDLGNNFAEDGSCPGDEISPGIDIDTELAHNGGPTQTYALLAGSVAVDAAGNCDLDTDQRGAPRDDGACDSGSFEFGAVPLLLSVTGSCPGLVTVEAAGASPNGTVRLFSAAQEGSFTLPQGSPCAGTEIDLEDARPLRTRRADELGELSVTRTVSKGACDLLLQAVDARSCAASNVVQAPLP